MKNSLTAAYSVDVCIGYDPYLILLPRDIYSATTILSLFRPSDRLQQSQPQRTHNTSPNHSPPRHNHLLIRKRHPHIPHQMS